MPNDNALHDAAKEGNLAEVLSQLSNFDINAKGMENMTALCWAVRYGHTEVVKLLLTYSPDVNIPSVSSLKMIYIHLICIFTSHIFILCHHSYTLRLVLLSRVVDVPPTFYNLTSYSISLLLVVFLPHECNVTTLSCFDFTQTHLHTDIPIHSK